MKIPYPTIDEPATPEYVLAVLRDEHRQDCQYDPVADADRTLSPETTIDIWLEPCDLIAWRQLGHALNDWWDIACTDAEWRAVLVPTGTKQLSGVCRLIAKNVTRPGIRSARLFGSTCARAGAFLTIRSLLHEAGASGEGIAPSTPLAPYARRYSNVFLGPISRLAPGSLPLVRIRRPVQDVAGWGSLAGFLCLLIGGFSGWSPLSIAAGLLLASSLALGWFATSFLLPSSVEFGEIRTFRDLAVVVAEGSQV